MLALGKAAAEAKEQLIVSDERLQSMLAAVMGNARTMEEDSSTPAQVRRGLDFLRSMLVPVFGPNAAQCALILAANGSGSRPLERMTRESWNLFLERLSAMISIVCGDVFAGLIREHGQLIAVGV